MQKNPKEFMAMTWLPKTFQTQKKESHNERKRMMEVNGSGSSPAYYKAKVHVIFNGKESDLELEQPILKNLLLYM